MKIHLEANELTLYKNKLNKEHKFGIMKDKVDLLFPILLKDYNEFIVPNVDLADIRITIDNNFCFTTLEVTPAMNNNIKRTIG